MLIKLVLPCTGTGDNAEYTVPNQVLRSRYLPKAQLVFYARAACSTDWPATVH